MRLELPARSRSDKMMAGPGSQTDSSSLDTGLRAALMDSSERSFVQGKDRPRPGCAVSAYVASC